MDTVVPASVLGIGLYPLAEAARLAQIDAATARRWSDGYDYRYQGEWRRSPGVISPALPQVGKERDLTFEELLTLRLVHGFRKAGLGLITIRRVSAKAAADYGQPMPFVSKRFRTDGRAVFIELRHMPAPDDAPAIPPRERQLIEVLSGQQAFADVVEPSLYAHVDWHEDMASRWWPVGRDRAVLIDPTVLFGAPRIVDSRVPTAVLASAVSAEGGGSEAIGAVAQWYGVSPSGVRDAVHFETEWLSKAA